MFEVEGEVMAKYGKAAGESVKKSMHKEKRGKIKSGKGGKGGVVKSRKQDIAIGLSQARKKGAKVPYSLSLIIGTNMLYGLSSWGHGPCPSSSKPCASVARSLKRQQNSQCHLGYHLIKSAHS